MRTSMPRRLVVATLALAAAFGAQAASYRIVDLGPAKHVAGINKQGDIAGTEYGRRPKMEAIVGRDGQWKHLHPRDVNSRAEAINAGGDVAGWSGHGREAPALWPRGSARIDLPLPAGAIEGYGHATDLSDDQVVVGYYLNGMNGLQSYRCFRWTAAEGSSDLGTMDGGRECWAYAINRAGQIVGQADDAVGYRHAFLYEDGVFRNLGALGFFSVAHAINNQGHVVGTTATDDLEHAFLWSGGTMKLLAPASRFDQTEAFAINDHGDIVGYGYLSATENPYHALRFADGQEIMLETEVENLEDWQLEVAQSVNEAGVIVGKGLRADGMHGFELVPVAAL